MREFFHAGVAPARGLILAQARAVARWAKAVWLICLLASLLPSAYAQTTTRGFGNGANQFTMDFVTIGNPNNLADTTGTPNPVGSVAYTYNLGKHEVSRDMINKANAAGGLGITLPDMTSFGGNGTNRPATGISWYEAAKYVNWLNTSTGGTAAYKFSGSTFQLWSAGDAGYNANNPFRNSLAKYWLPSSDEWYKGAYGSPGGTWYNFATGSDANPTAVTGGTNASSAVYSQTSATGPADITNAGGLSAYGTMAQSGNIHEWMETAADGINNSAAENRDWRGGRWTDGGSSNLNASNRFNSLPTDENATILGFRVASADLTALDSDGDGLSDAVETNTGVFVSASGTGTNPNNPDTDGDGISDDVEVNTLNSNPNVSQIPEALLAQQSGPNGFVATWGAVTGAAGYEVQVSTEPSFTSGLIGEDRTVSLGTTTSLGITGISNQIRYYRVRSVLPSQGGPLKTAWSPAVSAPDRSAFGKYATLNATGNADNFQPATNSSPNNNSYTITFWMRPDRLGGVSGAENVQVVRQGINSSNGWANVDLDLLPDGSLSFGQKDGTQQKSVASGPSSILINNWYHVAMVRDATNATLRLYLNGTGIATNSSAFGLTNWTINNSMGFAATQDALNDDANTNRIRAAFDDVRIYRTVRTPSEILQDMGTPLSKTDATELSSLVFYAPLEGTSLISTDANSFFKGALNGSGSGTITSQSVLTAPILAWTPSPINLVAPAVLSTNELTASATAPTGGPVSGSWSYSPSLGASLSVGTNVVVGTFVPADLGTYSMSTITNRIVVTAAAKANPTVTVNVGSYTYNGSYQGPGVSEVSKGGSTGAVTLQYGGNAFSGAVYGPSNTPPTNAGNYTVVATVAEDANYNQASSSPTAFTISKAQPTVIMPTASSINAGLTLSSSNFSGGTYSTSGAFAWVSPTTIPSASGSFDVVFTPADLANFTPVTAQVAVTVNSGQPPLLSVNFNDFTGSPTGTQYQTGHGIVSGASLVGWVKEGADAVRLVNYGATAANWAVMIQGNETLTMASGVDANTDGAVYTVSFDVGAAIFSTAGEGTGVEDQLAVRVIDEGNGWVTQGTVSPGAWSGTQNFFRYSFYYTGQGTGTVRLQVAAANPTATRFAGAIDNITITAAPAAALPTVTFLPPSSLVYDGTGKIHTATASGVSGFSYEYRGRNSTIYAATDEAPVNAGDYTVKATSTDPNYTGFAEQDFTITKAAATVTLGSLSQIYNGSPKPITVTINPVGVLFSVQYNLESTPPRNAGTYPVLVTVTDPNYSGSSSGTLAIAKATPLLSGITATGITQGQSLSVSTIIGTAKNAAGVDVAGSWSFQNPSATPSAGTSSQSVTFTPTDTTNYEVVSGTVAVTVAAGLAFTYAEAGDEITITGYTGTGGNVVIPDTILGKPVTSIGNEAFKNVTSIANLTLPSSLTAIGQKAFEGCTQLTSINLPNSVATIGQFAFAGCSSLTSITLPTSLTLLENYLFAGCGALSEIVIPNGVTTIGANAFESCANLVSVTLPSSVTLIKSGAFFGCSNLAAITIPSAVTTIEGNAFLNCSKLASVTFLGNTPPTIGVNAFSGIASGAVGYYPATASGAWGSVTIAGLTVTPFGQVNRAPVITGQSTTYDALAEFIAGPALQSASSRWQYLGGNVSALALLGNWKTTGNEIIQNQSQWDGNSGYLSNYPFVQRVNSASGPTSANTLVLHPSNLEEANRAVAIGWKNTSGQTVAANFNVNLRLPYDSGNGIDYKLQRGLAGASRYLSIRSGSLQAGGSVALASDALLEMQAGEMLYLIVDSKNNFDYDHTEVSAFTVTVAGGTNLGSISQGVASASNSGTAVTVLTEGSSDDDSGALKGIAITGVDTSHGFWEYTLNGGSVWNSLSGVNIASARLLKSDAQHRVRFVPNANFSGNAEIRYQAWDQTSGEDGALADLTVVGGGAWVLVAYGANASLGGFLTAPAGSFSSSARTGSAVLPGSLDILKNSMELAMTWTASGGSFPSGGIGSYTHGIAFALPHAAGMSFDGSATSPLIYNNDANPLNSSFAVGSSNPDQSLVNVRTLVGSPGMPSQMYLRNKTFGAGYGSVYGVVMNNGSNAQLDYNQVPDSQTFKAVYLDHGTGAAQGQGLVMGGSGGASNSYVPSTMALWARLDPLQVLALSGGNPVSTSGNYLLDGVSTTYVDVIDFDATGAFSAETATGTIQVLDTSVPVITLIGANPLEIYKGATFSDPGATVTDNVDTTRTITGSGTVNTATVGNYTLNYNATDAAGNPAVQMTRTVNVVLDPAGDEDGDGVTNGAESSAGTNPLVKNILRFQTINMLALGKGNFSIPESNGVGGGTTPAGFRFGTAAYYGGVPFFISDQANQVWHAARAPGGNGTGVVSETFPIAVNNVYGFYTLAGLWWGAAGSHVTYTFNFSDGSSYSKNLTNNVDLRDYNIPSSWANSINGTTTQNVFVSGNYHLDRQWIDFSAAGHGGKNLVSFTVTDRGASGSSRIFLAAATAQVGAPGQIPPGATDTDGDGILDSYELGLPLSTKPDDADTDDDGLSDGTEISGTTDPLVADVDNDGLKDGVEFAIGTNPLVADSDGDGTPDGDEDADNDGGSNRIEVGLGNSLTVANVYNRLINGSFEDGTVKPSPDGWRAVPQNDVPGWKTTANNEYTIELWYSGFLGSSGNDGNTLAELNYIASGTLYQDVTMTVNSPVSYSFLHRGRDGSDVMDFKIDELSGGPGTSVVNNKFTRRVTTGTSWIRYSGSQATEVEAGKTYRFSYTSISPTGGNGNLLDDASFGIDQDGDGLTDSVETNTGAFVSANNTGTNPANPDSDNDGLKDGEEVITYSTNPLLADTDGDGAPDGVEVTAGTNPKQNSSLPKPVITSQPVSITNTVGASASFSVSATNPAGTPSALGYQWSRNGIAITVGTNPVLSLSPVKVEKAGNYSVVVTNLYGAVTSSIATLTVNKATPTIRVAPTASAIAFGQILASSTLSGGSASVGSTDVPGSFAFTTPSATPNVGTASQGVTFTPTDTANYNTVTASVSVTVNQALISSGFSHTLYLGAGASTVTAWGMNTDGRLGVGDTNSPVNWARAVQGIPANTTITGLSAGGTHSLILAGGQVYAAGSDRFGQLGQGGTNRVNRSSFTNVFGSPSNPVVAVSAGGNHSLIVTESGQVFACGDNAYGQLGQPATTTISASWLEIDFPGRIVSVASGADHNLAVDEDGGVWVWGRNNYGQLGKGTRTAAERTPSKLTDVTARSVAAGFTHSLILKTSGTVLGFGRSNVGQAGQDTSYVTTPTPIEGLVGIESIAAGTDSSFAIDQVGQLRSWGYNAYGELLLGYASPISSPGVYGPTPSPMATNVSTVAGGGYSSLAWGLQGLIFGGRNDVGQSGNGPDPEQVVGDYYYYEAGDLALTNLTMDLAGTTETLYDQIFVGNGEVTLNGILNLMFVGTYTGPVYGSTQTFDLIWAEDGIVFGTGYQLAFNQAGYLVESAVADKSVNGVAGKVLQATVRAVVTAADLAQAVQTANPILHEVLSSSYGVNSTSETTGQVEMIYSYERPTGGVSSGSEYFVGGTTYRVEYSPYLNSTWNLAQVTGTTVTPLGNGRERVTLRINSSGGAGFLQLTIGTP